MPTGVYVRTESHRAIVGAAARGKKRNPKSAEHLVKLNALRKGTKTGPQSVDLIAKLSALRKGKKQSAATIAKRMATRFWERDEYKAKQAASHTGKKQAAEHTANVAAGWVAGKAAEASCKHLLAQMGYGTVLQGGWPDLLGIGEDGRLIAVEVKAHKGLPLQLHQEKLLRALADYGIPCFRWSPDGGLQQISGGR